jgi:TolB protein
MTRNALGLVLVALPAFAQTSIGVFEGHSDVGAVLHPGTAGYDPATRTYTITGSGDDMWAASDAFQFVWKKVSGDVALAADIAFTGAGGEAHRKGVLMIRQSLDADSAYVDAALHGNGLTSIQARDYQGGQTHEVQSFVSAPRRLRIEKRGDRFYMFVGEGPNLQLSGGGMRLNLTAPFYVGLGVCAHNQDNIEKIVFSNVVVGPPPASPAPLYTTLEVVRLAAATDQRAVVVSTWSADGAALYFRRQGRFERVPAAGGAPEPAEAPGPAGDTPYYSQADRAGVMQIFCKPSGASAPEQITSDEFHNTSPYLSPDGKSLVFLSTRGPLTAGPQEVTIRILSLVDKRIRSLAAITGGAATLAADPWSPDGRQLAFVSYQPIR